MNLRAPVHKFINWVRQLNVLAIVHKHQTSLKNARELWWPAIQQTVSGFDLKLNINSRLKKNKDLLITKFMSYKYEQGNNIIIHITAIEELATQLSDLGTPVSDGQVMAKITMTLPPSYISFLLAWNNIEESKKTIALLTTRVQCEENMSKMAGIEISNQFDSELAPDGQ